MVKISLILIDQILISNRVSVTSSSLLLVSLSEIFQEARKHIDKGLAILLTIEQAVRSDSHHFSLFIEWHTHVDVNILFSKPLLKVRDVFNIN